LSVKQIGSKHESGIDEKVAERGEMVLVAEGLPGEAELEEGGAKHPGVESGLMMV
jgi:hypothetical protein